MRIGMAVLPSVRWPELTAQARTVESAGFDTLVTGDHLRHPLDADFPFLDGWSVLAGWAVVTSRVRLAMLVSNAIYRTPALLAKQAIAVDHISEGRLDLGIGSGVFDSDHDMAGVPRWSLDERVGRTDELVVLVDRLLRGVVDDYEGRWYFVRQAAVSPLPVQRPRPPIVVGANHARMLRVAAVRADVWNTWGGYGLDSETFVEVTGRRVALIDRLCAEQGRDPATLSRSVLVHHSAFDPWRSTDAFRRIVDDMAALRFSECIFYWPRDEERATFDRVATDVLPALRS
jgi:alkanesulfonate monooxygenase SsuD/methylene tetrahydromethanopterin reductase-like flavin-dependent oxidoreductase (luciferase family)